MAIDWKATIVERRDEKDEYFRSTPHSPIPPDGRESFDGLSYYAVDETYR